MRTQDIKKYKDFFRDLKEYDSLYERVNYGAK